MNHQDHIIQSWHDNAAAFPTPMPWYFRTLASWLEAVQTSGLTLESLREPLHPETGRPASLILVAKKA
jgi:hypothetical protein